MELSVIENKIYEVRGLQVMLDFELAELYNVETRTLNQSVRRNIKRFPDDFMFQLTLEEWSILKSQFVTSSWGGTRKLPYVFTEQGVAMLSSVLRSDTAISINISIMRVFVGIRRYAIQNPISKEIQDLKNRIADLEYYNSMNEESIADLYASMTALAEKTVRQKNERKSIGYVKPDEDKS